MTDKTTQAVTPEPQAGQGKQEVTEPKQPNIQEPATATTWNQADAEAEIKALRAEAAKWLKEKQAAEKARETAEAQALQESSGAVFKHEETKSTKDTKKAKPSW